MKKLNIIKLINGNNQLIYTYTIQTIIICSLLFYKLHEHDCDGGNICSMYLQFPSQSITMHKNTQ